MKRASFARYTILTAALMSGAAVMAQSKDLPAPALAPFPVDHEKRVDSAADARFLLDAPAGNRGFVEIRKGHLYTQDGQRFRCWGVNLTGWAVGSMEIPSHEPADSYAAALARLGVNCVRMHFLDRPDTKSPIVNRGENIASGAGPFTHAPRGLIRGDLPDSQHFNEEQLERLDYWVNALKRNGVYINFNLNVGRRFKEGDGVPDADLIQPYKAFTIFGPELVALQKDYARQLLGHRNVYTGLRYADDPAVAFVEVVNENSLIEFWQRGWLRGERVPGGPNPQLDMTPHYQALLVKLYNEWLAKNRSAAQITELKQLAGVGPTEAVTFMRRVEHPDAPRLRLESELDFLVSLENEFHDGMKRFLRDEVGVKVPIIPMGDHTYFMANQALMRVTSRGDVLDTHVYWQHPAIYGRRNEPMVNSPELSIIQKLARSAMVGKPYTVSEVNQPFPSEYSSELIPILASYGALQDWDGIYFYTFEAKEPGKWTPMIPDNFDITLDPARMALLPVGSMIFLRRDVSAAKEMLTRSYSTQQVVDSARLPRATMPYYTPGFDISIPLVHGSRISCIDCKSTLPGALPEANPIVSDTGELAWRTDGGKNGLVSIDSPRTQGLIGFVSANPEVSTRNLAADIGNRFASITLSALDGKPLNTSDRMLLTTTGNVENTDQKWDERRSGLVNWGKAPTLIEPIKGWIQLRDLEGAVGVYAQALDGSARPIGPERSGKMIEPGWEIEIGDPPTTTYLIRVVR